MPIEPTVLLVPGIYVVTLLITGTSAIYVQRQKTVEYLQVRNLLVFVHIFYMGVVGFELARNFVVAPPDPVPQFTKTFLDVYTMTNTTLVLVDVLLLTLVAVAIYYKPSGKSMLGILRELAKHQTQTTLFAVYVLYIAVAEGFLLTARPWHPMELTNMVGNTVIATGFNPEYLDMLLGILLIFMVYPSAILLAARARSTDREVRRAFAILPVAWSGIGLDLLIFNGYLLNHGIDASPIGYLFAAGAFAATAATFRRATLLSAFFQPAVVPEPRRVPPASTFSGMLGVSTDSIVGKEFLLEADPSGTFEGAIKDLAAELGAKQHIVFVFTSRGSPVRLALEDEGNVRFFTMTTRVSYAKEGENPREVLVPANDPSVLLNVMDKATTTDPNQKVAFVFDSVTAMLLSSGLEVTYKFLKQAIEMADGRGVTSVFLLTRGAHSEKEVNLVRSLFGNLISNEGRIIKVQKGLLQ